MQDAGIPPRDVYITNAVKHFKFIERGKRRIHAKPKVTEVRACEPWLEAEIAVVRPKLVVAQVILLRPANSRHHRIHQLKVARVVAEGDVDFLVVGEFSFLRISQVIFHIPVPVLASSRCRIIR